MTTPPMRRTILIIPALLSTPESQSFLREPLPAFSRLAELGALSKVAEIPTSETPEAMILGLAPQAVTLNQGPLTVSALGFDPPERSTHFHLSLMSFDDGTATTPSALPTREEVELLLTTAKRLDTKLLTVLKGEELDHALVWEALGDMGTKPPSEVNGRNIRQNLPEGDGESTLRRFIDDSINLLSSLELNERRLDEGLQPFNLLWPWGQGVRTSVPNLALRRGEPAIVESNSMRLAGLTRLSGYRHADRAKFGKGLQTKLRSIAGRAATRDLTIIYIDVAEELRSQNKQEELAWFIRELDRELLQPLLEAHLKTTSKLTLIAPAPMIYTPLALDHRDPSPLPSVGEVGEPEERRRTGREGESETVKVLKVMAMPLTSLSPNEMAPSPIGLAVTVETALPPTNPHPFDERALEDRAVPKKRPVDAGRSCSLNPFVRLNERVNIRRSQDECKIRKSVENSSSKCGSRRRCFRTP